MIPSGALVTGAGRGIRRAIATVLAERGDRVVGADVDEAAARATADELTARGPHARSRSCPRRPRRTSPGTCWWSTEAG